MNDTIWQSWEKVDRDGLRSSIKSDAECREERNGVRCPCASWAKIRRAFPIKPGAPYTGKNISMGLGGVLRIPRPKRRFLPGNFLSRFFTPIAKWLRLRCIDKKTGQLKPESPCAKRRDALNKIKLTGNG